MRLGPLLLLLLASLAAGCASEPERPTTQRQALYGLGERAAQAVVEAPDWAAPTEEIVLLLARPDIDTGLGVDTEHFRETLTRALLAQDDGPQVLNWVPSMADASSPDNQWLLKSQLVAQGPALRLSDRELLPYRLELSLFRPGSANPRWRQVIDGALDASAL
ncbi:hypothetical protein SAMN02745148_02228 [Modicisalibacter ilicicola DSM 19980]|uniref:Lipoprotein n=1 Tax=Modicisalibacter ilicicola DSM 19980 TaxID=1121942 RepID=A0A1M5AEI3_9GAMM|nr:hypothetical protein [Halomonas ilicicola]SHF28554.1 hypothetical protein SAMN02745148_02228 [Halomonas ilicicola DSM 19980]